MDFHENVSLDSIEVPTRNEKLHPYEDEDPDEWEEFKLSIGKTPNKPLEVIDRGNTYELVDGDRRFRALDENDAETAPCFVLSPGDDVEDKEEKFIRRLEANEFRKNSNKKQRSRYIAQLTAPWLIPPGDRESVDVHTQKDLANRMNVSPATISTTWLEPMRTEYPVRNAVASTTVSGRSPDEVNSEKIDRIVKLLKQGDEDNYGVIRDGQQRFFANEVEDKEGVSLSELETASEKAVDEGWNSQRILEYVQENFAHQDMSRSVDDVDAGMMGDDEPDPFQDDRDIGGVSTEDISGSAEGGTSENGDESQFEFEVGDVDWSEHVDDSELQGETLSEIKTRRMMNKAIQGDAAIAINVLASKSGKTPQEVVNEFVSPLVVENSVAWLQEQ